MNRHFASSFSTSQFAQSPPLDADTSSQLSPVHMKMSTSCCLLSSWKLPLVLTAYPVSDTCYSIHLTRLLSSLLSYSTSFYHWAQSQMSGNYPMSVSPAYKSGDPSDVYNYCPISLLSLPSRGEHLVHNRLSDYLHLNSLISPSQFGFQPGSSTQDALLYVTHDWHTHIEKGHSVASIFFKLMKAFNNKSTILRSDKLTICRWCQRPTDSAGRHQYRHKLDVI